MLANGGGVVGWDCRCVCVCVCVCCGVSDLSDAGSSGRWEWGICFNIRDPVHIAFRLSELCEHMCVRVRVRVFLCACVILKKLNFAVITCTHAWPTRVNLVWCGFRTALLFSNALTIPFVCV